MWFLATWIGRIIGLVLILVIVLLAAVGIFYATDQSIDATVTETSCESEDDSSVTVKTKMFSIVHTTAIDQFACQQLDEGNFVEYHVRSGHTIVYDKEGGDCIWDSEREESNGLCEGYVPRLPGGLFS